MSGSGFFFNQNKQVSVGKVLLGLGSISAGIVLAAGALQAYVGASAGAVIAFAIVGGGLSAALVYGLVIQPLLGERRTPGGEGPQVLTTIDPLTHTLNRRGVTSSVLEAMAQAQRYGTPLSIAAVQIDRPGGGKERTRAANDSLLPVVAQTITDVLRLPDRVGRQTDDEFLVVMPQTKLPAAIKVADRIRAAIEQLRPELNGSGATTLTVSVGVTEFKKGQDLEKLLTHAQAAMQEAKKAGGNRAVQYKNQRVPRATS